MVHRDQIWKQAFASNSKIEIESVLFHEWIQRKWTRLRLANLSSVIADESGYNAFEKEDEDANELVVPLSCEELIAKLEKEHTLLFRDLSLLYRVNDDEGWYVDNDDFCYYIVVEDWQKQQFRIIYARLALTQLDLIVKQACSYASTNA